ncbi:conserved Plasmodium protein, unknown function [Plasmodium sp. gorilla clade G2]|uniref:conserved Plasmodium protein, unknown function n=1 Tax=Plasmodium sp. gorilla clade G2 TaxID=880535 RepID=UPI000D229913|nr:conserved Plasmodium protein, unknown function [Plasmodium sp. gorilla clade G2]SOV19495.1 conserved Plasmodium protein, unknown function [Plasmodium sp. gorilla clade G2]
MISSKSTDIAGLNSLRSKNINEIAQLIKVTKEKKKRLCNEKNERENIKQLENFVKEQNNCFNLCKQNLYERLEKDLNEYIFFTSKNKINLNEEHIQKLYRNYNNIEQELCYSSCSKKYSALLDYKT